MESKRIIKWGIKQDSRLLAYLSGEPFSASAKTSNPFCFRGLCPLDPQRGSAPVPRWGPRRPPDPLPSGGPPAPVPPPSFHSPATSNHFDNPDEIIAGILCFSNSEPRTKQKNGSYENEGLSGVLKLCTAVMRHDPAFKMSAAGLVSPYCSS